MAAKLGADTEKAEVAGLFHDACKNLPHGEMNELIGSCGLDPRYKDDPNLAHSKLAACILRDLFHVDDEDILNAISFHTTGRANMSLLEKIIYAADATEPGRKYKDAKRLNRLCYQNLDLACLEILQWNIDLLNERGIYPDKDTIEARDWFLKILGQDRMSDCDNNKCDRSITERRFMKSIREQAILAAKTLDNKKASNVVVIDITGKSSFADFFVIATGGSERQVNALVDSIDEEFSKDQIYAKSIEGKNDSGWILMDYGDIIVNVFTAEMREKYNLEKIWGDCEIVDWEV